MLKLTLPIQDGKEYVRRDGLVTTASNSTIENVMYLTHSIPVYTNSGRFNVSASRKFKVSSSGRFGSIDYPYDLVSDYVEQPAVIGHVHSASMKIFAEQAAFTEEPWLLWEWRSSSNHAWSTCVATMFWGKNIEYRQKPKFMNINGFDVPEPMRVPPEIGSRYWTTTIQDSESFSCYWDGDWLDAQRLANGICHFTKEAAIFHADAVLSFSKL